MIRSIVRESESLRSAIKARLKELKWTQDRLSEECAKLGRPEIRRQSISRYLNGEYKPGILNDEQVIFISILLDIPVQITVGHPPKPVNYKIPKYDQARALQQIKQYESQRGTAQNSSEAKD